MDKSKKTKWLTRYEKQFEFARQVWEDSTGQKYTGSPREVIEIEHKIRAKELKIDENPVGWYRTMQFGNFGMKELCSGCYSWQQTLKAAIVILYDPIQSQGKWKYCKIVYIEFRYLSRPITSFNSFVVILIFKDSKNLSNNKQYQTCYDIMTSLKC